MLIHYRVEELPDALQSTVVGFNRCFQATGLICLLNVINTSIVVGSQEKPPTWVL